MRERPSPRPSDDVALYRLGPAGPMIRQGCLMRIRACLQGDSPHGGVQRSAAKSNAIHHEFGAPKA